MAPFFRTSLMALVALVGPEAGKPSISGKLENLWNDLGTDDPVMANKAITALVAKMSITVATTSFSPSPSMSQTNGPAPAASTSIWGVS